MAVGSSPPPRTAPSHPAAAPNRWPWLVEWFRWYAARYLARHFHAVRLSRRGRPPAPAGRPVVVALNHPSWWDPLFVAVLTRLFPGTDSYGPIDAAALRRYGILGKVGLFGIEPGTVRGASVFLRTARAVLARPNAMLWVTVQGRFADVRTRPVEPLGGVGRLARQFGDGLMLPLALEYPFWDERTPEALAYFGEPLDLAAHPDWSAGEWTEAAAAGLTRAQDALAAEAMARDPAAFETLIAGRVGVGGVYDLGRRLLARLRGRRFQAAHSDGAGPRP
jgi:1-acyl-sn-glycerol-3-phosphate acyltransferase